MKEKKNVYAKAVTGVYKGFVDERGIANFHGIPFVKPPERWKRAKPLEPSEQTIDALEYGPICPQPIIPWEMPVDTPQSEDCLTLNIWTADVDVKGKPVMVWIYPGSFLTGSNRVDYQCGDMLCRDHPDVVVVSINYRLGVFGCMDLSAVDEQGEYADSINLQLFDQTEALRWIHENIAAFGGDPDNVTLFGLSSGSASIFTLMLSEEANPFFHKAICSSSGISDCMKDMETAHKLGKTFMKATGAETLSALLALSPEKMLEGGDAIFNDGENFPCPFDPVRDGIVMPLDPYDAFRKGVAKHIKLLAGTTAGDFDTMCWGQPDEAVADTIRYLYPGKLTEERFERYCRNDPDRSRRQALDDYHNDIGVRIPVLNCLEAQCASGAEVYSYYDAYIPEGNVLRTQHMTEIPFLFDKLEIPVHMDPFFEQPVQGNHPDPAVVSQLQGCWVNFARTGNPGGAHIGTDWPAYRLDDKRTMVFDNSGWHVEKDFRIADTEITQPLIKF